MNKDRSGIIPINYLKIKLIKTIISQRENIVGKFRNTCAFTILLNIKVRIVTSNRERYINKDVNILHKPEVLNI
jgi:hypothetical protein